MRCWCLSKKRFELIKYKSKPAVDEQENAVPILLKLYYLKTFTDAKTLPYRFRLVKLSICCSKVPKRVLLKPQIFFFCFFKLHFQIWYRQLNNSVKFTRCTLLLLASKNLYSPNSCFSGRFDRLEQEFASKVAIGNVTSWKSIGVKA